MLEDSVKTIRNGEIVQGTVIDVKEDEIILNIGYKADGIITKSEYSNDASLVLTDAVHVGDSMEAKVLKVNDGEGQVILTYKRLAAEKGNKRLEAAFESQEVLKAPVTQVLDGGLCVNVEEARVFIPASLVSDTYEKDLSKYADKEIEFVITEFNPRRRRIIGNRKQLLLAEKAEKHQHQRQLPLGADAAQQRLPHPAEQPHLLKTRHHGHQAKQRQQGILIQIPRILPVRRHQKTREHRQDKRQGEHRLPTEKVP